ncbi:PQQ-dependent sugar dehydrogenase [Aliidiomarina soli]|nr:PQQ-dependent sugar dehydrogenase [Aliidiomarina soli]
MRTMLQTFRISLMAALLVSASPALAEYTTTVISDELEYPWGMEMLPDGRILVTEQTGALRIINTEGELVEEPIANVPEAWVEGHGGLFDVKLAPDFADSNRIYLSYACGTRKNSSTCLARALFAGDTLNEVEEIFRSSPGREGSAHYGGRFTFLADNTLVMGLGDGFDYREQAQNPENHIGSVVRLNMDGSIPANNPFVGLSHAAPETYSYGHRNVQGIVYDPQSDRLYTNEHGPKGGDELNLMRAGANYGWPLITGGVDYNNARITPYQQLPGMTSPLLEWTPSIAPSGMTLYRGDAFGDWRGDFFVSALAAKKVQRVRLAGNRVIEQEDLFTELDRRIRYVYTGADGYLYLLTDQQNGELIRVTPKGEHHE